MKINRVSRLLFTGMKRDEMSFLFSLFQPTNTQHFASNLEVRQLLH